MALAKLSEEIEEKVIENQETREQKRSRQAGTYEAGVWIEPAKPSSIAADKAAYSKPEYKDKILFCKYCGQKFLFSAGAQKEYARRGWSAPKRCKPCRSLINAARLMKQPF